MGNFFSLSESWTSVALHISEVLLLVFGIVLVIGLIGEYWELDRKKLWGLLVIIGVAGELLADGGIFAFSERLQTFANNKVAELNTEAAQQRERASKLEGDTE